MFSAKPIQRLGVCLALVCAAVPLRSAFWAERAGPGTGSRGRRGPGRGVLSPAAPSSVLVQEQLGVRVPSPRPGDLDLAPASLRLSEAPPSAAGHGSAPPPPRCHLALCGLAPHSPVRVLTPRHPRSLALVAARPGPGLAKAASLDGRKWVARLTPATPGASPQMAF